MTTNTATELPAIAGGTPAKTVPYTRFKRYGDQELRELREALEQGTLFYAQGKKVSALERAFAEKLGAKFAVACSSGTSAIHAAVIASGISPGDEVIVSPITDMGTIFPVLWQGAVPIFADLDERTYNLSPASVEQCITSKMRAIIAVHLAGNSCDLHALRAIADKRGLVLIEDCAQSHGCEYDNRPSGTFGQIGCFSYNEFKHISCGDGGVVVTNDDALARKLRLATDKAYDRSPGASTREATFMANNYRMTELQGAVALAQLEKLDWIVSQRRSWCTRLTERLAGLDGILIPRITERCNPSWWFYMLRIDPETLGADADEFAAALKAEQIPAGARYIQKPIYQYPLFLDHSAFDHGEHPFARIDYRAVKCPSAEKILATCVIVYVNEGYTDPDLDETVRGFEKVVKWFQSRR